MSYVGAREYVGKVLAALRPGGMLVVEGFHRDATKTQPIGGAVVFDTNELLKLFDGLRVLRYEDAHAVADFGLSGTRVVRLAAVKPYESSSPRCRTALASAREVRKNPGMLQPVSRVVDLLDPALNRISNMTADEARRRVLTGDPAGVLAVDGSFALVAAEGITVRLARSLDRPMRYFLAKRHEGPALYVADRIDTLHQALATDGLAAQFHPSYTRMVPAHYIVEIALVGCPDPDPVYTRFFTPATNKLPANIDEIGRRICRRAWRGRSKSG